MVLATRTVKTLALVEFESLQLTPEMEELLNRNDTFPRLFLNNVRKYGDRTALREKVLGIWKETSWRQYFAHVKTFALGLKAFGFDRENTMAILADNCPEWLYADLAIECLGGIPVGVYPTNTVPEVEYILSHSDARHVVVGDQEQLDKVLECKSRLSKLDRIIVIDMKGVHRYTDPAITSFRAVQEAGKNFEKHHPDLFLRETIKINPGDVSIIVYTSGTTGPPKGAMLTHRNLLTMIDKWREVNPMYDTDETVSYLPLCHILERVFSLLLPLRIGYVINFAESLEGVQKNLKEIAPTIFAGVPRIWEKLYSRHVVKMEESTWVKKKWYRIGMFIAQRYIYARKGGQAGWFLSRSWRVFYWLLYRPVLDQLGLRRARFLMCGAAPVAPEILEFFNSIGLKVREGYGQTECSGLVSVHADEDIKFGSVGPPVQEIRISEDGEILVRGPCVFKGYYKNPEATAGVIIDGWLSTGDVGYVDEDGHLHITDRKKDIIITSGGKNVSPQEIENRLKVSPYIKEAVVIGDRRKYLTALIEIDEENVGNWAQRTNISYTTYKDLSQNEKVYELITKTVNEANKAFASVETIKRFWLLDKGLDQDDEELTATQKVRRKIIEEKYRDLIESLYK